MARGSSPSTPSLPLTEMKMTSTRDVVIILKGPASIQKERLSFLKSREWWWKILRGLLTVVKRLSILESPRFLQVNLTVPTERSHLHSKPTCMILVCMAIFGGPFLKPTCPTPLSSCKLSKKKEKKELTFKNSRFYMILILHFFFSFLIWNKSNFNKSNSCHFQPRMHISFCLLLLLLLLFSFLFLFLSLFLFCLIDFKYFPFLNKLDCHISSRQTSFVNPPWFLIIFQSSYF